MASELIYLGVAEKIEKLQFNDAGSVYKKANYILKKYFKIKSPLEIKQWYPFNFKPIKYENFIVFYARLFMEFKL